MVDNILSDPLSVSAWSRHYGERRSTTKLRLKFMQQRGVAVEFGGRYQIRASEWPLSYRIDVGLFPDEIRHGTADSPEAKPREQPG